jgi:two-component system alkaline phosphatase synthesis response regulator PhoP
MYPKILVVDDNEDLLLITQIILKGQGYEIVLAKTIDEAMQKIKIHRPALILLDVFICRQDGRQFCRRIKSEAETSNIRVILMSGDDVSKEAVQIADDFLPKPFDYEELIDKVDKQLSLESELS